MNTRISKIIALTFSSAFFLTGCGDNDSFISSTTVANSGTISQKHFTLLIVGDVPAVFDADGNFTSSEADFSVLIADRFDEKLTDSHTIYFETEYGLLSPSSCITSDAECSVTWTADRRPEDDTPGADYYVTVTAYTTGEEGFTDTNNNDIFDDGDAGGIFDDLEEPFIDADRDATTDNGYSTDDIIIDVKSTNDTTGKNGVHDIADGFFNGSGCTHSSLCGDRKSITIFDSLTIYIGP